MDKESRPLQPEDVFRQALCGELYGYHLFEVEDRRYYLFQPHETGDSVWLAPSPLEEQGYRVRRVAGREKLAQPQPVVAPCTFEHCVPIELYWAEDGETKRIENELRRGGKTLAQKANQAFTEVLTTAADTEVKAQGKSLNQVLAQAVDDLAERGFTADTLLFPKRFRGRFLADQIILPNQTIQNDHYTGETITGLRAFWSDALQDETVLVFDSTAGLTITQEPKFWVGQRAFAVDVCGTLFLNPIVKNTQGVVRIEDIEQILDHGANKQASGSNTTGDIMFVDPVRIDGLRQIASTQFDLTKLVRFCEELNMCYASECYLAVAMLTRATLDHVPPIFGCSKFAEVANNYGRAGKSFKECMQHLENSLRNIADLHLHSQIRSKEALPAQTQVNFSSELDLLLSEIMRILVR